MLAFVIRGFALIEPDILERALGPEPEGQGGDLGSPEIDIDPVQG